MAVESIDMVLATLRADNHVVLIEGPEGYVLPEISLDQYSVEEQQYVSEIQSSLGEFFEAPYIVDDFTDHNQRVKWNGDDLRFSYDCRAFLQKNALRVNSLNPVISSVELLIEMSERQLPKARRLFGQLSVERQVLIEKRYDFMTNGEKHQFVKGIKAKVHATLQAIAENS